MAINCIECGSPVHENAVKCPHCGKRSGAVPTKPTKDEAAAIAQVEGARFYNEMEAAAKPTSRLRRGAQVAAAFQAVSKIVDAASTPDLDRPLPPPEDEPARVRERARTEPAVPKAVARDRPSAPVIAPPRAAAPAPVVRPVAPPPPVIPVASKAPEPAPPPGDQPRFLK